MGPLSRHAAPLFLALLTVVSRADNAATFPFEAGFAAAIRVDQIPGPSPDNAAVTRPPATASIVGQVIDVGTGQPVAGAIVSILLPTDAPLRVLSDTQGRFAFHDLPAGSFNIETTRRGFLDGAYGRSRPKGPSLPLSIESGAQATIEIPIWRFGAISGRVVDEAGEPAVGVLVRAFRRSFASGRPEFQTAATDATDDRGIYRIGMLVPGDYLLFTNLQQTMMIGSPGPPGTDRVVVLLTQREPSGPSGVATDYPTTFFPSTTSPARATVISVTSGQQRAGMDFRLEPQPTHRISGILTTPDGTGGGLTVMLSPVDDEAMGGMMATMIARSDASGAFTFASVYAGDYVVRVSSSPGPMVVSDRVAFAPAGGGGVPISVEGVMTPMAGRAAGAAASSGRDAARKLWAALPVSVGTTDVNGLEIALRPALTISGAVEWHGTGQRPAADVMERMTVLLERVGPGGGPFRPNTRLSPGGQFEISGLVPGFYSVLVQDAPQGWIFRGATLDGGDVTDAPLHLESGDVDRVRLILTTEQTNFVGTIADVANDSRDAIAVIAFPVERETWGNAPSTSRRFRHLRVQRDQPFSLGGLPPGRYHVVAVPDVQTAEWRNPEVLATFASRAVIVDLVEGQQTSRTLRVLR